MFAISILMCILLSNCKKTGEQNLDMSEDEIVDSSTSSPNTISISTGEWVPWTGEKIYKNGFVAHILKEIFKLSGYDVKFQFYPWERAYQSLVKGKVQASAYWYPSDDRKKDVYYSNAIFSS